MNNYNYVGGELDLFALAVNWKQYWFSKIKPYLGRRVLEVGAGIGSTTKVLVNAETDYDLWLGIEPDAMMVAELQKMQFPAYCDFQITTVYTLDPEVKFDSIIYIDVLEHIEDDQTELLKAAQHIREGGYLIVLSPAYQFLFSEFDRSIGHYRRYNAGILRSITPPTMHPHKVFYLDSLGLITSLANRFFLYAPLPTEKQILFWDRVLVPVSRIIDRLLFFKMGRSVIYIWKKFPYNITLEK